MKSVHGIGLLNLIRERGPISRADLAKASRLSKPTVSSLVDSLIRRGLVFEEGPGQSGVRGGKIPTLVKFNAGAGVLAAVEIGSAVTRAALTDLEGVVLDRHDAPTEVEGGAERVLERAVSLLRAVLLRGRGRRSRLRLIAVATSGRVDVGRGVALEIGNVFNWSNVAVRERIGAAFKVPVFVDNDVNMAALGELHHGAAAGENDFVLIRLQTGIGCGVVLNRRVHHGAHWAAGEIAHAVLSEAAAASDWGPRGYLENVVAEDRVAEGARQSGFSGLDPVGELVDAAARGHAGARAIVDRLATHLGLAAALVAAAYDPPLIVLQGRLFRILFERVAKLAARVIPWGVEIRLSTLGEEAVLLGTTISARSQAYERIAKELKA